MDSIQTIIENATLDLKTIEDFVNLPEGSDVRPRLLPSVDVGTLAGIRQAIFETGGLPATPFATKALMTASALVNGDYAMVTDDTANNGLYVKTAGTWVKSNYDPVKTVIDSLSSETTSNLLYERNSLDGYFLAATGIIQTNSSYSLSDHIEVDSGETYYYDGMQAISYFGSDGGFISRSVFVKSPTGYYNGNVTIPAGVASVRLNFEKEVKSYVKGGGLQFSKGVGEVPYIDNNPINSEKIRWYPSSIDTLRHKLPLRYSYPPTSTVNTFASFLVWDALVDVEFWGLPDGEQLFLRTLYNNFNLPSGTFSSVGFNSSANYHIAPALSPQNDMSVYAAWSTTERLTGIKEYLLYKDGNAVLYPPMGVVRVNWDVVPSSHRYIDTNNGGLIIPTRPENALLNYLYNSDKTQSPDLPFAGKKIGALGDSITWGFRPRNDPDGASGSQLDSWLVLTANKLGMAYDNRGISGSTLGSNDASPSAAMSRRFNTLSNDCDFVVVMGGTNDVRKGVPLGTIDDRTDSSYYGALHVICEGLINKYQVNQGLEIGKTKHIVLATPIKLLETGSTLDSNLQNYAQAVRDVAAYYSLPVLDLNKYSNINPHILQTVQGTVTGYMGVYNPYITDGTHPTQQGHEMMANYVTGFLKTLV